MTDKLITILPSDIISESMIKINQNFEFIASKGEITDQKLLYYVNGISDRLKNIETQNSQRDANLMNGLNTLDSKIEGLSSSIDIQDAIDKALANANIDVEQFIMDHLEDTLNHKLGDYVTTSVYQPAINSLTGKVSNIENNLNNTNAEVTRIATSFDDWKANAVTGTASASRIVANSTFYKTSDGYLVDKNGNKTNYKTLESWYDGGCEINGVPQINEIDPQRKGLDDEDICTEVISAAKGYFRTVIEQLSQIKQWVDQNSAGINIVAAIEDEINPITAAIFVEASKTGSTIKLGADRLDFSGNKRINFETGMFTITSNNFNIDADGNVSSNNMTSNNATINGDITANTLNIRDGILTGNLFVSDSDSNVTAGMIGSNTSDNDVRFFAGISTPSTSSDFIDYAKSAPFCVLENGELFASKANIGGDSIFSGTISFPFNDLLSSCVLDYYYQIGTISCAQVSPWAGSRTDPITGSYYEVPYGMFYRHMKPGITSFKIPSQSRYYGSSYSSYQRTQCITLPEDMNEGVILNIIANGYNYKNVMSSVHIIAPNGGVIYYETNDNDTLTYNYGNTISTTSELVFGDVFYLRLLSDGDNNFYVVQILGKYAIGDGNTEPDRTRSDYVGVGIDGHPEREFIGAGNRI